MLEKKIADNRASHLAWETNAVYWDNVMGDEGNDFVNMLIWPPSERLLVIAPGNQVLEIACGNGIYARRMAALGADVTAIDFSEGLIDLAQAREPQDQNPVAYHVLDATDEQALLALGVGRFDAAVCQMGLMDMADIVPLAQSLSRLLKRDGRFLFSVMHPSFNGTHVTHTAEQSDEDGELINRFYLKLSRYLTPTVSQGVALRDQPVPQPFFHRPLHLLLAPFLGAGFVVDALEEVAFPPDYKLEKLLSWGGNFHEFSPVMIIRMKLAA